MPMTAFSYLGRVALLVLFILVLPDRAAAQGTCSTTSTDIIFGNVDTLTANATLTTGTINVTCSVTLSVLGSRTLTVRLGPGSGETSGGPRLMTSPASQTNLGYQLYSDAARTQVFSVVWVVSAVRGLHCRVPASLACLVQPVSRLLYTEKFSETKQALRPELTFPPTSHPWTSELTGESAICLMFCVQAELSAHPSQSERRFSRIVLFRRPISISEMPAFYRPR